MDDRGHKSNNALMDSNEKQTNDSKGTNETKSLLGRLRSVLQSDLDLIPYKLFYTSVYGAGGCLLPYLPLYYKQLGFSAVQTGILLSIRPLSCFLISPFWGFLADRYQKRRIFLVIGALTYLIKTMSILIIQPKHQRCLFIQESYGNISLAHAKRESQLDANFLNRIFNWKMFVSHQSHKQSRQLVISPPGLMKFNKTQTFVNERHFKTGQRGVSPKQPHPEEYDQERHRSTYSVSIDKGEMEVLFYILLALMIVGDTIIAMVYPVADSCLIDLLSEKKNCYGRIRLWGALSSSLGTLVIGIFIDQSTFNDCGQIRADYKIAFYFSVALMAVSSASILCMKIVYSCKLSKQATFLDIIPLCTSSPKFAFWMASLYLGMLDGFQTQFTSWFLDDLGASSLIVGAAASLHYGFNMVTFFFANYLLDFLSYIRAIGMTLAIYVVLFSCLSVTRAPWLVLFLHSLAGTCFSISWVASVAKVGSEFSSGGLGTTAQGILFGLYMGAGLGGGASLGGVLITFIGIRAAYRLFAGMALLVLIMYSVLSRIESTDDTKEEYQAILTEDPETVREK
ncbi:major facilitator superfamily domain-containing protein 6-like [Montipora capricornis]|uniref:major facilitator superfamily domain-containing protein 6-like n=1 Tax=Montipora capricornis TaxID=246305 RepID=UPI0035F10B7F